MNRLNPQLRVEQFSLNTAKYIFISEELLHTEHTNKNKIHSKAGRSWRSIYHHKPLSVVVTYN